MHHLKLCGFRHHFLPCKVQEVWHIAASYWWSVGHTTVQWQGGVGGTDGRDGGRTWGLLVVVPWPSQGRVRKHIPPKLRKNGKSPSTSKKCRIERVYIYSSQEGNEQRHAWRQNVRWKKGARKLHWLESSKGFWTDECLAFQNLMSHSNQKEPSLFSHSNQKEPSLLVNIQVLHRKQGPRRKERLGFSVKKNASHLMSPKRGTSRKQKGGGSSFPVIKQNP